MHDHSPPLKKKARCFSRTSSDSDVVPSEATGKQQQPVFSKPTSKIPVEDPKKISTTPPPARAPGLLSPTAKAFEKLTVGKQKPQEKHQEKQKRRQAIYGLTALLAGDVADGRKPRSSENGDGYQGRHDDDEDDGDDNDDDFPHRHKIQRRRGRSRSRSRSGSDSDSDSGSSTRAVAGSPPKRLLRLRPRVNRNSASQRQQSLLSAAQPAFQNSLPVRTKPAGTPVNDGHDLDKFNRTSHEPGESSGLKRKRVQFAILSSTSSSPPPSPPPPFPAPPPTFQQPYTRTNDPNFNVFSGFLLYPELCLHLATQMPVDDLIALYAISRDFHAIIDARFTTVILSIATQRAYDSYRIFPFRCYRRLCRTDPVARLPHPDPRKAAANIPRMVPSFRWLKMVMFREAVVHEIMAVMAEDGVPMPRRCAEAMKKIWFMLDIPDNARRVGYIHNPRMVSDLDLYFIVCTIIKMDMRFNDPVGAHKFDGLRRLLLAQTSLSVWLRVLKREVWTTQLDIVRAWLHWKYEPFPGIPPPPDDKFFGVPLEDCGKLGREYWGLLPPGHPAANRFDVHGNRMLLMRPDQLVLRESVRRGLRMRDQFLQFLLYGYIDLRTLQSFEPRKMSRRIAEWDGHEYGVDGLWGTGVGAALEAGGRSSGSNDTTTTTTTTQDHIGTDDLLDLGPAKQVSELCIERTGMGTMEREMRMDLQAITSKMKILWKEAPAEEQGQSSRL